MLMTKQAINQIADMIVGSAFSNVHSLPSVYSLDKISSLFDELTTDSPTKFGERVYSVDGFGYPFNVIYQRKDEKASEILSTRLEFALAGFSPSEIDVRVEDDELIVEVKPEDVEEDVEEDVQDQFVKRGISKRKSIARFALSAKIDKENITSEFKNGLLIVRVPVTGKNTIKIPVK
jgi:HSP20 family molecular chaperone IbpA